MGWIRNWYGDGDPINATPAPTSDTDRIIAEQRRQGAQTRSTLTLIFVGIPVFIIVVVGLILLMISLGAR